MRRKQAFQTLVDEGDPVLMESPAYSYAEGWARLEIPDKKQEADLRSVFCLSLPLARVPTLAFYLNQRYSWCYPTECPGARR